jgi:hypothetical protein
MYGSHALFDFERRADQAGLKGLKELKSRQVSDVGMGNMVCKNPKQQQQTVAVGREWQV